MFSNKKQVIESLYKYSLNKPFFPNYKETYDSIIPLKLFTCWHTKQLPPLMRENYKNIIKANPKFEHYLFDETDCFFFIMKHFSPDVLNAYKKLIPSSYKSDLWRYCILYINGGIYMDIKFQCVNGFKFIALTENEYFVRDRDIDGTARLTLNGLISVKPNNKILLKCINQIVENVKTRFYGINCLDPTGPGLLGKFTSKKEKQQMELYYDNIKNQFIDDWVIIYKNTIILKQYSGYRTEQTKTHYSNLWTTKHIYALK
jgi:mannosyltransferase OCH1-like enzyme